MVQDVETKFAKHLVHEGATQLFRLNEKDAILTLSVFD
jgi:hypothetical protein